MNVGMAPSEVELIVKYLNKDMIVLEYGSGGSTTFFPKYVKMYHSIEHDKTWFNRVGDELPENARLYWVPQNFPRTQPTRREQFVDYVEYINSIGVPKYNAVLIDGRARVACAIEVIRYLTFDSVVFLHDSNRAEYLPIFNIYDVIEKAGSLRVLKINDKFLGNI